MHQLRLELLTARLRVALEEVMGMQSDQKFEGFHTVLLRVMLYTSTLTL